jgi:hypothetical protein
MEMHAFSMEMHARIRYLATEFSNTKNATNHGSNGHQTECAAHSMGSSGHTFHDFSDLSPLKRGYLVKQNLWAPNRTFGHKQRLLFDRCASLARNSFSANAFIAVIYAHGRTA